MAAMNKIIKYALIIALVFAIPVWAQDDTLSMLFIGNSHTYYNDLPHLFSNLAASGGKVVTTDMSAPGGYTLEQHTILQATLDKIAQGGWDYVVLQEQSQYPTIEFYRYNSMYPAARHLDSLISAVGAQTVMYMTWGWRYGGMQTINGHSSPDFVDYFQMQDSVSAAYRMIAGELQAVLSPAGDAWATAHRQDSTIIFWQPDNYHPTLAGSYLTSCVFYYTIFNESPIGLSYNPGLDPGLIAFLQRAADQTVSGIADDKVLPPGDFELIGNYPNPFNESTTIKFSLQSEEQISIEVFDILGRRIAAIEDKRFSAGYHSLSWDGYSNNGTAASSGRYYVIVKSNSWQRALPITLLK
jgi:hypothetical protein